MTPSLSGTKKPYRSVMVFLTLAMFAFTGIPVKAQPAKAVMQYTVSMPDPASHHYQVVLYCGGWNRDSIEFKMPKWMPGYYQLMNYAKEVEHFSATDISGKKLPVHIINENTWLVIAPKNKPFRLSYEVKAEKQFVANSFLDSTHGYIIPAAMFVYINGHLGIPVSVEINTGKQWPRIATGLEPIAGKTNEFMAPDFDILYDSPLLIGDLEELPSFTIKGIEHRFIGYKMGEFDRQQFMSNLKKVVEAGVNIIGDIPYRRYTFIAIGPGRGGIEHLNNSTVSFDGKGLNSEAGMTRTMNFLAHEYFHHYNVKRIRPFELGPFDYGRANRTNLLWVSEGLSVYYEYMMVKRAAVVNEQILFKDFEGNINALENNPGRLYQSLIQSSYQTWGDGPFGRQGAGAGKTISYYDKGPVVGLLLDLAIRHATQNKRSLDDVMRLVYRQYYQKLQRGFTDGEFQQACEEVAGVSLAAEFEYAYTTKELDYNTYLAYAGLKTEVETNAETGKKKISIRRLDQPDAGQLAILRSWLGEE